MTPPSYRLDVVCGSLLERLEGTRRTWLGDPEAARAGFRRIAEEVVDGVVAERAALMGEDGWGEVLRREVLETFLPRYTRLAVDHNALEEAGYRAWRGGDPVARVVAGLLALLAAALVARFVHHPLALVAFAGVLVAPFTPEIRQSWFRRRYRRLLQEVIDDMARIQDELERQGDPALLLADAPPASEPARRPVAPTATREPPS